MPVPQLTSILRYRHPLVLLDSGRGLDESVYLQMLYKALREDFMRGTGHRSRTYLFYPPQMNQAWYDIPMEVGYDEQHRRPIRDPRRKLELHGMLHTAAKFEKGCIFKREGGIAPWKLKYNGRGGGRATFVYLNPTRRDLEFAKWNHPKYWQWDGIPTFILGDSSRGKMPMGYSAFVDWVIAYSKERAHRFQNLNGKRIGRYLDTQALLDPKPGREDVVLAGNHGNQIRQRHPEMLQGWLQDKGVRTRIHDAKSGQAFLDGLHGRYYCVLSRQEANFFDILMAQARGMIPVLPNVGMFLRLNLERAIYYPASSDGDLGIKMNTLDARTWFHNAFQSGRLKTPTQG